MTTVKRDYTLQFARRPPRFCGVLATTVRSEDAQVIHAEVINLLEKGPTSPERVRLLQQLSGASHAAFFEEGTAYPLKAFQRMLGFMAAASPVLRLGLFHMRPIQFLLKQRVPSMARCHGRHRKMVSRACVSALARWRDLFWLKQGLTLDTAHRRKVVTTDNGDTMC